VGRRQCARTQRPSVEGTIFDGDGKEITYKDEYRVDFITDRAERFLRQKHEKPFFLFISQLEPHQQNDMQRPVGPKGSVERFANSTAPEDLRALPGTWQRSTRLLRAAASASTPPLAACAASSKRSTSLRTPSSSSSAIMDATHDAQPGVQAQYPQQLHPHSTDCRWSGIYRCTAGS